MGLRERIEQTLNDIDYPADKQHLVAQAEAHGPPDVVKAVRALPLAEYHSDSEVLASVPMPADESRSDDEKARQASQTRHQTSHLAEHMRDVESGGSP